MTLMKLQSVMTDKVKYKELVKKLSDYLEEESIERDIEEYYNDEEYEKIRMDYLMLGDLFRKLYKRFSRDFRQVEEGRDIVQEYHVLYVDVEDLYIQIQDNDFYRVKPRIIDYVKNHWMIIVDFVEFCMEVYSE